MGTRLKEERERLGLSQPAFAELGGAKKHSQINYEADRRAPDSDYLSALAKHGVDVLYVLTGRRTPGHELTQEIRRKHGAVLEMDEVGENLERLEEAEAAAGQARVRDDLERWVTAIAAVEKGLPLTRRISSEKKAELILAAYDLLEEDTASSRDRIIRLVRAS